MHEIKKTPPGCKRDGNSICLCCVSFARRDKKVDEKLAETFVSGDYPIRNDADRPLWILRGDVFIGN